MIVYTAIFGKYDRLREPTIRSNGFRYVCFTDQNITSETWEIVKMPKQKDPRRKAREMKIKYYEHFMGFTIWVDSHVQINVDLNTFVDYPLDIYAMEHPDRSCIYKEHTACKQRIDYEHDEMDAQVARYKDDAYPKNNGLVATGVLIRKDTPEVRKCMRDWWKEVRDYSCRDQLSFNYVLWKRDMIYGTIPFCDGTFIRYKHGS